MYLMARKLTTYLTIWTETKSQVCKARSGGSRSKINNYTCICLEKHGEFRNANSVGTLNERPNKFSILLAVCSGSVVAADNKSIALLELCLLSSALDS